MRCGGFIFTVRPGQSCIIALKGEPMEMGENSLPEYIALATL